MVAGGVVVGFPLLTSFALTSTPASHGAVVIALLPAATAMMAVLRGHERPPAAFWMFTARGALWRPLVSPLRSPAGSGDLHWADLLLFGAVLAAAIGYAEGGLLARELGSWQTVSWALVSASPLMVAPHRRLGRPAACPGARRRSGRPSATSAVVSMFLGFFAWYRGLAIGPMAQVSQVQLVQPVLSICWAGLLLGEHLSPTTILGGLVVVLCAGWAVRSRAGSEGLAPAHPSRTPVGVVQQAVARRGDQLA